MSSRQPVPISNFYGPTVVRAAFVLAMFGWGLGFYGPPIYLHAVLASTQWPVVLVSGAVTLHFLVGAVVVAQLPRLHKRLGLAQTVVLGALATAFGIMGWALAAQPWQLLLAACLSGAGWVTMGAAAINAIIAPWYARGRSMALAKAYNGASIGGVVFLPLWSLLIGQWGFAWAALCVGVLMLCVVSALAVRVVGQTPEHLGQCADGVADVAPTQILVAGPPRLSGNALWHSRAFLTLAFGMAAGLFAQIGLLAHLYAHLVPAMGTQTAGLAMAFATACAIAGRLGLVRCMPANANWRVLACLSYGVQIAGGLLLLAAAGTQLWPFWLGLALFGAGIGNATSLPPLIAQQEFAREDTQRVVALIVAMAQASYAFAPLCFSFLLGAQLGAQKAFFGCAILVQFLAMVGFLAGRNGPPAAASGGK
jgi:MFS family permease